MLTSIPNDQRCYEYPNVIQSTLYSDLLVSLDWHVYLIVYAIMQTVLHVNLYLCRRNHSTYDMLIPMSGIKWDWKQVKAIFYVLFNVNNIR